MPGTPTSRTGHNHAHQQAHPARPGSAAPLLNPQGHPPRRGLRGAAGALSLGAIGAAGLVLLYRVSPYDGGFIPCPLYALTGLYCPGCGSARSTHELLHGNIDTAFAMNPLWPVALVALVALWVVWVVRRWRGESLRWGPPSWLPLSVGGVVLLFAVLRNIPGLDWLGPV